MENEKKMLRKKALIHFEVIAAAIVLYFFFLRFAAVSSVLKTIFAGLKPLILGFAVAFVLRPAVIRLEALLKKTKLKKAARPISIFVVLVLAIALFVMFCAFVFPQLIESIRSLVTALPDQIARFSARLEAYLAENAEAAEYVDPLVASIEAYITDWIQNHLLASITALISNVVAVGSSVISMIVALIVTLYLLLGWERYNAQCKKLFLACSKKEDFNLAVFDTMKHINTIFNGFIVGKIVDSMIIGVICFVVMALLRMPYTLLISVIVGVTNVIPMFGPFIGAVPSAFLILLVSPSKCLIFLVFILILQQLDGNVIGPFILGDSTGLSALYVTLAILLFGKLFGFIGMLLGVPTFASLYYIVKRLAEAELKKRSLPTSTEEYIPKN